MAIYRWEVYTNTWADVGMNTLVFSGDASDISAPIAVEDINMGTHLGSDDPGTDMCGGTHVRNVAYISDTQFLKGTDETVYTLNDSNLFASECTVRVNFSSRVAVNISAAKFYAFDGNTAYNTGVAVGIHCWAFQRGVTHTEWTLINDQSDGTGGFDYALDLVYSTATATEFAFYLALSVSPESRGEKTQFDLGIDVTYS